MCLIFNISVGMMWLIIPKAFSNMMPSEIRKAAPIRAKKDIVTLSVFLYPLYIFLIAYSVLSAFFAGVVGFWNLFWMGYIEMFFVNMGDFFGLDWLFREKMISRIMIPGTEHCKAWQTKEWMFSLGIVEHWVLWPLIVCPAFTFVCAGIGMLIR